MSRKWMVAGAVAAVVAIVLGARLGRDLLSDDDPPAKSSSAPDIVRFHETVADVSLSYPASWKRAKHPDEEIPLLILAPDRTAALQVRRSETGLEDITRETLAVARKLTDPLFRAIKGTKLLEPVEPVELGGLFGWRYRYTYRDGDSARDHYFVFKRGLMLALVFEVSPASRLRNFMAQFDRIARSLRDGAPA
ncbi:MAG: hypothetical protein M3401_04040 [Actinomycetota bacterium]|nr:hypothetical protein [Actinomycetota bacterium]